MSGDRDRFGSGWPGTSDWDDEPPRPAISPGKVTLTSQLVSPRRSRRSVTPGKRTATSRLAPPAHGGPTAGNRPALVVSTRHITATLPSDRSAVGAATVVSVQVTVPAGASVLPLACRMRVSPGVPPVVGDPGVEMIAPGSTRAIELPLSGIPGRSDLVFQCSGSDGATLVSPVITVHVKAAPDAGDLLAPRQPQPASPGGAARQSDTIRAAAAAPARRRASGPIPPPRFQQSLIECDPTAGGATSMRSFALDLPANEGFPPPARYSDLSLTIESLRQPKDMAAFELVPIPTRPASKFVQGGVLFHPPRAGSYQAWVVFRGVDEAGHRFEDRTVVVGESPHNGPGLIDDEALSAAHVSDDQAIDIINTAWQIMQIHSAPTTTLIGLAPNAYRGVLESLAFAQGKLRPSPAQECTPDERLHFLEAATARLDTIANRVGGLLKDQAWVDTHYTHKIAELRRSILFAVESRRVQGAQDAGLLDFELRKASFQHVFKLLADTAAILGDQALRTGEKELEKQVDEMEHGGSAQWGRYATLAQVQAGASLLSGVLGLTDEEMWKELREGGLAAQVGSALELTSYLVKTAGSMRSLTATWAWALAKRAGNAELETAAAALAQDTALKTGMAVTLVELAHDLAVLLNADATGGQKEDAVGDLGSNASWIVGKAADRMSRPMFGMSRSLISESTAEAIEGVTTPLTAAVFVSYQELRLMAWAYDSARMGLASGMSRALKMMNLHGRHIATTATQLATAGVLLAREHDHEKRDALGRVRDQLNLQLAGEIEAFLNDCQHGIQDGQSEYPGNWTQLAKEFEKFDEYRGVTDPAVVPVVAKRILEAMSWCNKHADYLIEKTAGRSVVRPRAGDKAGGDQDE